jgi:hypothetical protein
VLIDNDALFFVDDGDEKKKRRKKRRPTNENDVITTCSLTYLYVCLSVPVKCVQSQ